VIRVPDPATGVSKPKWVGGFDTEEDAKAARDEARVRARRGEYVNRSISTVADYLAEWVEAHASTVKPKTLAGYRHDIDHYIVPRIGRMRLQALRPAVISKLYRDLADHGGRDGRPLSAITVSHIHRTLRKALADAVDVGQLLAANPAARSKRPKSSTVEPVQVWTPKQLGSFLATARSHRLYAFYRLAVIPAHDAANSCTSDGLPWTSTPPRSPSAGQQAWCAVDALKAPPKGPVPHGQPRPETVTVMREHRRQQTEERLAAGSAWNDSGGLVFTSRWGEPLYPDTVTALMTKLINQHNKSVTPPAKPLPHARLQ
jgi:integrase